MCATVRLEFMPFRDSPVVEWILSRTRRRQASLATRRHPPDAQPAPETEMLSEMPAFATVWYLH